MNKPISKDASKKSKPITFHTTILQTGKRQLFPRGRIPGMAPGKEKTLKHNPQVSLMAQSFTYLGDGNPL